MKVQIKRDSELIDLNYLVVEINGSRFRLSEENGKLVVNKHNFDDDAICVNPQYANQIAIK